MLRETWRAKFLSHDVVLGDMLDHVGLRPRAGRRQPYNGPAPVELPEDLSLEVSSRRPLELCEETSEYVLRRPVPAVTASHVAPVATVVVPVRANLVCTRMALESVLANTDGLPHEVIAVDNGSAEPTRKYLEVLASRNRHVRVIRNEHDVGFVAGCNQAFVAAKGEILVLLQDDVIITPDWLDDLVRYLDDPAVGLVCPATNRSRGTEQIATSYKTYGEMVQFARRNRDELWGRPVRGAEVAEMFCVAMRRAVFEADGLFDDDLEVGAFGGDYARRVRDAGHRVAFAPEVFAHRFDEASLGSRDGQPDTEPETSETPDARTDEERTA